MKKIFTATPILAIALTIACTPLAEEELNNPYDLTGGLSEDEGSVNIDISQLTIGYASGDSASSVTQNITLPAAGLNGTTITWNTSNSSLMSNAGTVTRPAYNVTNNTVTMSATVTKNTATQTINYTLHVLNLPITDAESVAAAKAALDIETGCWFAGWVVIPVTGSYETTISWVSADTSVLYIINSGSQTQAQANNDTAYAIVVDLTATITKGSVSDTKVFSIIISPDWSL